MIIHSYLLSFYGDKGLFPLGENATNLYLAQWLTDTSVYTDAIEILAEKARRFWWAQQVDLGMISWTMLLAIEGRRRNMPLLWCYQLLGQLVSLSYAQNLFYLALLLTPVPLPHHDDGSLPVSRYGAPFMAAEHQTDVSRYVQYRNAIFPPKPENWTPHPLLYVVVLVPNFVAIALPTIVANTSTLTTVFLAARVLSLVPLVLPYVVPERWGSVHSHAHEAYETHSKMFKAISVASFALHGKATLTGLVYNAPDAHYHRHMIPIPYDLETRSSWERTTNAFGRILEATSDHPVVRGIGWDVLLSTLSLGVWTAVRGTDISSILSSSIPFYQGLDDPDETSSLARGTKLISGTKATTTGQAATNSGEPSGTRRLGRPRKVKEESPEDQAYEPTPSEAADAAEGDEFPDMGWDSTALAWGMTALGGLGVGSAGVFGGECVAR